MPFIWFYISVMQFEMPKNGWAAYPSSQVLFTECVGNHFRPHF
nr:MAG TPA: hypothetical protein [Caudoviricetes sp.]